MKVHLDLLNCSVEVDAAMVSKVLRRAAEIVDAGWTQGTFCRTPRPSEAFPDRIEWRATDLFGGQVGRDQFCVQGALRMAHTEVMGLEWPGIVTMASGLKEHPEFRAAHDMLVQAIGQYTTADWNDAPSRTAAQVSAVLRAAANACEA